MKTVFVVKQQKLHTAPWLPQIKSQNRDAKIAPNHFLEIDWYNLRK
jgi:hypothetical protein